jgi:hypothetical protein
VSRSCRIHLSFNLPNSVCGSNGGPKFAFGRGRSSVQIEQCLRGETPWVFRVRSGTSKK